MKRYLITYLNEGKFQVTTLIADDLGAALKAFIKSKTKHDEIYSITTAR